MILINETDGFLTTEQRMRRNARIIVLALTAGVTTVQLGRAFHTSQKNISNIINRTAMRLDIEGGRLGLLAHFVRSGEITLAQLEPVYLEAVRLQFASRSRS